METVLSVPKMLLRVSSLLKILPRAAFAGDEQQFWLLEHIERPGHVQQGLREGRSQQGVGEGGQGQQVPLPTAAKPWEGLFCSICSQRLLIKQSITEPEIHTKAASYYSYSLSHFLNLHLSTSTRALQGAFPTASIFHPTIH